MACNGAAGSEHASNDAEHGSDKSEEESGYLNVKLNMMSGEELSIYVDKDATIGQLVANMRSISPLLEWKGCAIVFTNDPDARVYCLGKDCNMYTRFTRTAWCRQLSVVSGALIRNTVPMN
jgi:hypothetical protein